MTNQVPNNYSLPTKPRYILFDSSKRVENLKLVLLDPAAAGLEEYLVHLGKTPVETGA